MDARLTYSIGYQYPDDDGERFPAIVADYADAVSEVYFSPGDMPSARTPAADASGLDAETADAILSEDIAELRRIDVRLSLLFNANCHGGAAVSQTLERRVCECVDRYKPDSATTASIFIAFCLKRHYHNMPVRTSVNMNLATPEEMEYVAEWFDAYCPSRELNYDLEGLERVKAWAYANGKELVILANSGCIRNCPAHAFHDNLVAHFAEIDPNEVVKGFQPVFCRTFYAQEKNRAGFLEHASFIRPEDIASYAEYASLFKLATRTHPNPRLVIDAYSRGRFTGNVFDLTEPNHGVWFRGKVLDGARIPAEWHKVKSRCRRNCAECGLCRRVLADALVDCEVLK